MLTLILAILNGATGSPASAGQRQLWMVNERGLAVSEIVADGRRVYVLGSRFFVSSNSDTYLRAYDAKTGAQNWSVRTANMYPWGLGVYRNRVFFLGRNESDGGSVVIALRARTGAAVWRADWGSAEPAYLQVSVDGVFVAGFGPIVRSYSRRNGTLQWEREGDAAGSIIVAGDTLYRLGTNGDGDLLLEAYSARDGSRRWSRTYGEGGGWSNNSLAHAAGTIYLLGQIGGGPSDVVVIAVDAVTGRQEWRHVIDDQYYWSFGHSLAAAGDTVYAVTSQLEPLGVDFLDHLTGLDARTGALLWDVIVPAGGVGEKPLAVGAGVQPNPGARGDIAYLPISGHVQKIATVDGTSGVITCTTVVRQVREIRAMHLASTARGGVYAAGLIRFAGDFNPRGYVAAYKHRC